MPASTAQVQQTQAYCAGRFAEWDEKITTFPGLYALGAGAAWLASLAGGGGGASAGCTLPVLRAVNLLPALATPPLLLALLRRLHPEAAPADLLGNALLLALLPTHFFYHCLYYTDSAATVSALLLLLLTLPAHTARAAPRARPSAAHRAAVACAAVLCVALRQTNAVWLAFALGCDVLQQLDGSGALPARLPLRAALAALPKALLSAEGAGGTARSGGTGGAGGASGAGGAGGAARVPRGRLAVVAAVSRQPALPLLLAAFAAFVRYNGGVVLGDKSNHRPALHTAQLLYLVGYAAAPFELHALTRGLAATLRTAAAAAAAAPLSVAAATAAAAAAAHGTLCHAFLLADNRHVSFYLWRHVLGKHPAVRYALVPLHVLLGWRLLPPIWARQRGQSAPLVGAPSSAPLGLLRARLAALGSSSLTHRGPSTARPATALGARAARLQSPRFPRL